MLSFFRFNDPYRLVFVFLILLIIRIPFYLSDGTLTEADLHYMVIGEKMSSGATLYIDIWDNVAPLAAGIYWFLDLLFGRSLLAYQLLSLILVTVQAGLFNKLLLSNKAINENSYVPALIYAICMSLFFDFFTLTPLLMSITFLLLALNHLFNHIEVRAKRDEQIFSIGLYIGIASLFYLPVILLAIATLLILLLFSGTVFRRYLLLSFGVMLPLLLIIGYYLLIDGVKEFYYNFFNPWMILEGESVFKLSSVAIVLAVPVIYMILGITKISKGVRFNNYQLRLTQVMFVWLIFSVGLLFLGAAVTPAKLMVLMPPVAFYIVQYFLAFRKNLKSEIAFSIFFLWIGFLSVGTFFDFFFTSKYIFYEKLLVSSTPYDKLVEGKSVVVLGDNINVYKNASAATPFLNWSLSKPLFDSPEFYDNVVMIDKAFREDPPDVIIDPDNEIEKIESYIPLFSTRYKKRGDDIYILNN